MSLIKFTLTNLRRKPYQNLAIFISLFITYTLTSLLILVILGSNQLLSYFSAQPQITAFIKNNTPEKEVNQLIIDLQKTGVIKSIHYTSPQEALKIYQKISNNPMLTEVISDNILPASLEISTYEPADLEKVYKKLEISNIVDDIIYQRNLVHIISSWINNLRIIGIGLISLFLIQAIITIWVVTGFKVSGSRESIKLMHLLGASRRYINSIFLIENTIIGAVAATLSSLTTYFIIRKSEPLILAFLNPTLKINNLPYNYLFTFFIFSIIIGSLFSGLLTFIGSRHFIKD